MALPGLLLVSHSENWLTEDGSNCPKGTAVTLDGRYAVVSGGPRLAPDVPPPHIDASVPIVSYPARSAENLTDRS